MDGCGRRHIDQGPAGIDVDPNHHLVPTQVNENTPTVFTVGFSLAIPGHC